jgi:outer membrane protein OmpA-like peptidoglycan-associated protein
MFNDYEGAAAAYKKVVDLDKVNKYQLSLFWLGEMLRSSCTCKNEEAAKDLRRFKNRYHPKDYYSAKAQQDIEACAWAIDHQKQVDTIKIEHLGKEVNTSNSEFNAIPVYPDKIQFSSLRNISDDKKDGEYLVRIYNQQPNPEKIYMPNGSNTGLNIGNGAYTPDTKTFYFTQCEQKTKVSTRCDIYVTHYENYKWSDAEKLSINDASATNTQPSYGYDTKGQPVLFFASDRSGGEGGLDIWVSKINADHTYSQPVNAGKVINTPGNEVTPFYDVNNKILYFSSDWHYGFGGYDIFKTKGEYSHWAEPANLMQPINTAQNDLYYIRALDDSRTYLTSNRKGSYFIEAETCCNDIYAYNTGKKIEHKIDTTTVATTLPVVPKDTPVITKETVAEVKHDVPTAPRDTVAQQEPPHQFVDVQPKKPAQFVPVELYFHNDEPECCNTRDTTALDYKETYEAYSALQNEYRKEFSRGLKGDAKAAAQNQINDLFSKEVDKGFYDLIAFTAQLFDAVKAGTKMEITIKGYCSPLHLNDYNMKLGFRRVASLRNYFFHYRDGALLPYISNGTLVLKSESLGKETAPKTVSDKLDDTRNSVYNPAAALERRVEVVAVQVK